eukprot:Gb_13003 [translate_table: standard]
MATLRPSCQPPIELMKKVILWEEVGEWQGLCFGGGIPISHFFIHPNFWRARSGKNFWHGGEESLRVVFGVLLGSMECKEILCLAKRSSYSMEQLSISLVGGRRRTSWSSGDFVVPPRVVDGSVYYRSCYQACVASPFPLGGWVASSGPCAPFLSSMWPSILQRSLGRSRDPREATVATQVCRTATFTLTTVANL